MKILLLAVLWVWLCNMVVGKEAGRVVGLFTLAAVVAGGWVL